MGVFIHDYTSGKMLIIFCSGDWRNRLDVRTMQELTLWIKNSCLWPRQATWFFHIPVPLPLLIAA
jgi:hypothetical protein